MGNRRRLLWRIEKLIREYETKIQSAFLSAVRERADRIDLAELASAIEARDLGRAYSIAGITRADLFPFDQAMTSAYVAGGQTVASAAPAFAAAFGFDGRARRAEEWARAHVGGLVTGIVEEQREMLQEVIAGQLARGIGPRDVAARIAGPVVGGNRKGGFIGLSRPQAQYLAAARAELEKLDPNYFTRRLRDRAFDDLVRTAIADSTPLARADIDRIAAAYAEKLVEHRAVTIARTESITALRAGRREGVEQAIEAGAIDGGAVKRVWNATLDRRTRPDHAAMNGVEVEGMDTPFVLPGGSLMLHPGDTSLGASAGQTINCRCYDEYVVDWLRR